jgi:hypothetical protein
MAVYWWDGQAPERYWLESTDRDDIGTDLRAPHTDGADKENWRYGLFRDAKASDIVFHYDKRARAITSVSRIAGPAFEAPITWAARGSYARDRGAVPTEVPGYRIPLADHRSLEKPLTLEDIRSWRDEVGALYDALPQGSRYFPFELSNRPIRPLQGYAFKLPASFVEHFKLPTYSEAAGPAPHPLSDADIVRDALAQIEAAAGNYAIAGLQALRARNRGLTRVRKTLFGNRQLGADWAFHYGGRDELQFNVGLDLFPDQRRAFRAGVAFSFEPSRSLPDIDVLVPKVARFNAYLRDNPEAFEGMTMWHWQDDERSLDYAVQPISSEMIRHRTFVFLGDRMALDEIDPHAALGAFDRLFPLYAFVEAGSAIPAGEDETTETAAVEALDTLDLYGGREIDGGRWIKATRRARTLDIFLRHREIQRRLKEKLIGEGMTDVRLEVPIGDRLIDAVVQHEGELWFYEVKTSPTVRGCLREAIGQLLEYSLWPGATPPRKLIVVGEPALTPSAEAYLASLNQRFPFPISYRQLALD